MSGKQSNSQNLKNGSRTNQKKTERNKKMNIQLRYSIPLEGGTLPGDGNFLGWCCDEEYDDSVVHDVELLHNGSVCIDLGASNRPCAVILDPKVVAAITVQTSPKVGERTKRGFLTKAIRGCGKILFFFCRIYDIPHVHVVNPSTGELLMES